MSESHHIALSELLTIKHGFAFKGEFFADQSTTERLVTPGNFAIGGGFQEGKPKYYSGPVEEAYALHPGDLLVSMTDLSKAGDTLGYPAIVPHTQGFRYLHNQRIGLIQIHDADRLDGRYLYYRLCAADYRHHVLASATGSTVRHTSPSRIGEFTLDLPPLATQRAIAAVLGSLDDKIEVNRRTARVLEGIARTIFRSWFVDFEPVRRAAAGESTGLPDDLAALFPTRLVDSPLGDIPEGWEVLTIECLCNSISSGGTPARMKKQYWDGGTIPWFKTGELFDAPLFDSSEHITEAALANSSCKLWPAGTILFALYASPTVGRMGVLTRPGTSNQAAAGLIVKPEYGVPFLLNALFFARTKLQQIAVGAAQQNINQGVLKAHQIVVPSTGLAQRFSELVSPALEKQAQLSSQSAALSALRDAMLPILISGELPIGPDDILGEEDV